MINKTYRDCALDEPRTVYADWEVGAYRCLVVRGPCSLCAYIGVKPGHPLYQQDYSGLGIDCHGGLTYAAEGGFDPWAAGYWWFGWDYAHSWDMAFNDYLQHDCDPRDHAWTPDEVVAEIPEVLAQFKEMEREP